MFLITTRCFKNSTDIQYAPGKVTSVAYSFAFAWICLTMESHHSNDACNDAISFTIRGTEGPFNRQTHD